MVPYLYSGPSPKGSKYSIYMGPEVVICNPFKNKVYTMYLHGPFESGELKSRPNFGKHAMKPR